MAAMGPVQLLVLGFDDPKFEGDILAELERLKEHDVVRVLDALMVVKGEDGEIETGQFSDLSIGEAEEVGALVGALLGFGAAGEEGAEVGAEMGAAAGEDGHLLGDDEVWYLADAIPPGQAAAIALLEHRWAIPLRDAIVRAGGFTLADEWVHPTDLVAIGLLAAAES
jgi:uncharacterized membrane protein